MQGRGRCFQAGREARGRAAATACMTASHSARPTQLSAAQRALGRKQARAPAAGSSWEGPGRSDRGSAATRSPPAVVLLPTPPFPDATVIMCCTPGMPSFVPAAWPAPGTARPGLKLPPVAAAAGAEVVKARDQEPVPAATSAPHSDDAPLQVRARACSSPGTASTAGRRSAEAIAMRKNDQMGDN